MTDGWEAIGDRIHRQFAAEIFGWQKPRILPQYPEGEFNGLAIIGEAPGEEEIAQGLPFVGPSGMLLDEILYEVGIEREECFVTNVFLSRPEDNNISLYFMNRFLARMEGVEVATDLPAYQNNYLLATHRPDIHRLAIELEAVNPRAVLTLGRTALWAVARADLPITKERGKWRDCCFGNYPAMPSWHPSAVLRSAAERDFSKLDQLILDISKAEERLDGTGNSCE